MAPRLAAVTGATGFLGQHIVRALAEEGWAVRILARRDPISPFWRGLEPELEIGALDDLAALERLCAGAEVLVHAAGLVKARSRRAFMEVNAHGARRAAEAAARAEVPRMVLISSLVARAPQLSHYAASKRAGEAAAAAVLGDRVSVVRPPAVYGPGDLETLPVFRAAARSPLLPVFDPRARIALIHGEDAARQIAAVAAEPPRSGPICLSDARPEGYGWREIVGAAAQAVGASARLVRVPGATLSLAGALGSLAGALGAAPMLTLGKARELRRLDWGLSPGEICPALPGARYGLAEGFAHSVLWARQFGLLAK